MPNVLTRTLYPATAPTDQLTEADDWQVFQAATLPVRTSGIVHKPGEPTSGFSRAFINDRLDSWLSIKGATANIINTGVQQHLSSNTYQHILIFKGINMPMEDILNWDISLSTPISRSFGRVKAKLIYAGRGTPSPCNDPWE